MNYELRIKRRRLDTVRRRQMDRQRLSAPMRKSIEKFYAESDDRLIEYLNDPGRLGQIRNYVTGRYPLAGQRAAAVKSDKLDAADFDYFLRLLVSAGYYESANEFADAVLKLHAKETFEQAARFALGKLGISRVSFDLRNPQLLNAIGDRALTFPESARVRFEDAVDTITRRFIEQGRAPYDSQYLRDLRTQLGYDSNTAARRFAQTEGGVIASQANKESYRRMNVEKKEWITAFRGVRPTHSRLKGVVIRMEEKFDVGGYAADRPLDPVLPADELINCRCDIAPVMAEDYEPTRVWQGE